MRGGKGAIFFHVLICAGPNEDLPVKVSGNVRQGFRAEFVPVEVGVHKVLVEYNGVAVGGTPFFAKAYDAGAVAVVDGPKGNGKTVTFAGESDAQENPPPQCTSYAHFTISLQTLLTSCIVFNPL